MESVYVVKRFDPFDLIVCERDVLLLRRSKAGGDARLHDKLSIGVGGQINPCDAGPADGGQHDLLAADPEVNLESWSRLIAAQIDELLDDVH